ncbi:hypothetical protein Pla123a_10080 [Posidoniimonas polymericola]|uniref:3-keto-alpha-glucoside-1,2-lyase/3-keto-2-hydroxy-glucal hydratase domain-containing protein n=1 Tax=Posidoniimonas polymericola TaxID=2528002 RepID=A0A5C5YTD8_9BACT|nr:DUF1080 domain-containing protein [Posidoniimonas polymericola]TWT78218.1 hypothetical protein Pla123a_10080 [Posidoniimonas polymericola]
MRTILSCCVCLLLASHTAAAAPAAAQETDGFVPLFDGESIDGWVKRGGKATYKVEDGEIVGTSVLNTDNTFLCTPRNYGDFELKVELKVDSKLNSGIQIRSLCRDEAYNETAAWPNGKEWSGRIPGGRVHGYQVEIDPSDRSWSGGIYDEARRGWLYNLAGDEHKEARAAFKPNEWNEYRIRCEGDHIQTWINGTPVADLHDDHTAEGFIALQVHGIGGDKDKEGTQVRWRNLMIKEL